MEVLATLLGAARANRATELVLGGLAELVRDEADKLQQDAQTLRDMVESRRQEQFEREVNERMGVPSGPPRH